MSADVSAPATPAGRVITATLGASLLAGADKGAFALFAAHSSRCCTCCSILAATSFSPAFVAAARILCAIMRASENRLLFNNRYAKLMEYASCIPLLRRSLPCFHDANPETSLSRVSLNLFPELFQVAKSLPRGIDLVA